ncbi:MAG: class I SAM-dependent methyltransferase [Tannerellaceae bacterium]|jgi:hypothetical protein|nr:class I SAM-dependent methyltransferase [Tannerellaceae bacterium]
MRQFIREHAGDNPERLLLAASRYPGIDVAFAVGQIAARRQVRDKLPSWLADDRLAFPSVIAAEQCSSEQTARYKQRLISRGDCLCDLSGGLGVDSLAFSAKARRVIYMEKRGDYCCAARHNFQLLGAGNIEVWQGEASLLLCRLPEAGAIDVFYIDPARRGEGNKRVFALSDCEPDLPALLPALLQRAPRVIAKLSPMADIRQTLELLPGAREAHVVSVRNDCKELLFVMGRPEAEHPLAITCINYTAEGKEETFAFTLQQEKQLEITCASRVLPYLYEPNASLLKAGAFKSVTRLGVSKLHPHSHLYTSERLAPSFPGRVFYAEETFPFSNALCRTLARTLPQANITARNFPLTVEELRKKTGIKDGGNAYLFATTLHDGRKALIKCRKAFPPPSGKEQNH